jgi:hypothetical protein
MLLNPFLEVNNTLLAALDPLLESKLSLFDVNGPLVAEYDPFCAYPLLKSLKYSVFGAKVVSSTGSRFMSIEGCSWPGLSSSSFLRFGSGLVWWFSKIGLLALETYAGTFGPFPSWTDEKLHVLATPDLTQEVQGDCLSHLIFFFLQESQTNVSLLRLIVRGTFGFFIVPSFGEPLEDDEDVFE